MRFWNKNRGDTNLYDILVFEFPQILYFADCRHVEAILELPNFDLLDGHLPPCTYLAAWWTFRRMFRTEYVRLTSIYDGVGTFTDFLVLRPSQ